MKYELYKWLPITGEKIWSDDPYFLLTLDDRVIGKSFKGIPLNSSDFLDYKWLIMDCDINDTGYFWHGDHGILLPSSKLEFTVITGKGFEESLEGSYEE